MNRIAIAAFFWTLICASQVCAHPGPAGAGRELPEILRDVDFVVVGHLTDDLIKGTAIGGVSWHTATLAVTRVIKGESRERQMRIVFHFEMDPIIFRGDQRLLPYYDPPEKPGDEVFLQESNMGAYAEENLRQDCIWLLTYRPAGGRVYEEELGATNLPGIWEMDDIKPLAAEKALRIALGLPEHEATRRWPVALFAIPAAGLLCWLGIKVIRAARQTAA